MKNRITLTLFMISALIISGIDSARAQSYKEYKKPVASPKSIINSATWENLTKDNVHNNTITALHLQGYDLEPIMTSKESGLIVTKPVFFFPPIWQHNWVGGEYYLNILVYATDTNHVSINIQIKGTKLYDYEPYKNGGIQRIEVQKDDNKNIGRYTKSEVWNGLTIKISEDIEQFLLKQESIQGSAISKATTILKKT
jgi:hypothetical protein